MYQNLNCLFSKVWPLKDITKRNVLLKSQIFCPGTMDGERSHLSWVRWNHCSFSEWDRRDISNSRRSLCPQSPLRPPARVLCSWCRFERCRCAVIWSMLGLTEIAAGSVISWLQRPLLLQTRNLLLRCR